MVLSIIVPTEGGKVDEGNAQHSILRNYARDLGFKFEAKDEFVVADDDGAGEDLFGDDDDLD